MATDPSYHDYIVHDRLHGIPGITSRRMFGGWALYQDNKIFAIIVESELYFKVHDGNRAEFEAAGSQPFVYEGHPQRTVTMPYWKLPEEILEDPEQLPQWIAQAATASKPKKSTQSKRR